MIAQAGVPVELAQRESRVARLAHLVNLEVAQVAKPCAPPGLARAQLA